MIGKPLDAEARLRREQELIRRAQDGLRALRAASDSDSVKRVDEVGDRCQEVLNTEGFPFQRKLEFTEAIKGIRRDCYQRSVTRLLGEALAAAQDEDIEKRNALMGDAKSNMSVALRLGVGPEFKVSVQRKVDVILMTSARGTDEKARAAGEMESEPERRISGAPGGVERRRSVRYDDPVLEVMLNDQRGQTVNWSIGGLLVEGITIPPAPSQRVRVTLWYEGVGHRVRTNGTIVDIRPTGDVALAFRSMVPELLDLVHTLRAEGIVPHPAV